MSRPLFRRLRHRSTPLQWLVVLLLVGQGLLFLHVLDHQTGNADQTCTICLAAQATRTESPPTIPAVLFRPAPGGLPSLPTKAIQATRRAAFDARAPPTHPVYPIQTG